MSARQGEEPASHATVFLQLDLSVENEKDFDHSKCILKNKSSRHLPVESNLHDEQIQIGLPVIWTGHARVKRHYVKAFYISFVTLIRLWKTRECVAGINGRVRVID